MTKKFKTKMVTYPFRTIYSDEVMKTEEMPVMTRAEFEDIADEKYPPETVLVDDKVYHCIHTCLGGYDGTCRCINHPRRTWATYFKGEGWETVWER